MIPFRRHALTAAIAVAAACSSKRAEDGGHAERPSSAESSAPGGAQIGITLDRGIAAQMGITTAPLGRSTRRVEVTLTGELIADSGRTAAIRAPITGRLWIADSLHWPGLGEQVEMGRILGQVSDARPLVAPQGGTVTAVSAVPGEIVAAGAPLLEITDLDHPLARVVWQRDAPARPPHALLVSPIDHPDFAARAELVGPAPAADPVSRSPAYLYRVESAWPGARPGAPVTARFPDLRAPLTGVFVPDDAVVQWNALPWVYVRAGKGHYVRALLVADHPVQGGYIVADGLVAGDTIVVQGAQQLLSEEFRPRGAGASEDEQ